MIDKSSSLQSLLRARLLVAFLGEKKQFGLWDTSFLDATGRRFLENPFPRTAVQAALRSTTVAAARVHDNALGKVGAYHLFRLPVEQEEMLDIRLGQLPGDSLVEAISSKDVALANLAELAGSSRLTAQPGPTQIGLVKTLSAPAVVGSLAAHYLAGFQAGVATYPYFA